MNIGLLLPILAVFVALEILRTGTCMTGDLVSSRWCFQAAHIAIPSSLLMIETGGRSGLSWFPLSVASLVWQSRFGLLRSLFYDSSWSLTSLCHPSSMVSLAQSSSRYSIVSTFPVLVQSPSSGSFQVTSSPRWSLRRQSFLRSFAMS